jgi:uncharacterized protein
VNAWLDPTDDGRATAKAVVLIEVLTAFAIMYVAFRAFKRFTIPGQLESIPATNCSPGAAMIAVGLAMTFLRRRRPREYGLSWTPWWESVRLSLVFLAVFVLLGIIARSFEMPVKREAMTLADALIVASLNLIPSGILLKIVQRYAGCVRHIPRSAAIGVLLLVVLLAFYPVIARGWPALQQSLHILWIVLGSAVGEEMFFRGYVQSRLNQSFGRPYTLFGVRYGAGLLGAALLFAVIHVLNPADYFAAVYRFDWRHGLTTATTLYFGFLRERTGGIAAPALVHGCTNLLGLAMR